MYGGLRRGLCMGGCDMCDMSFTSCQSCPPPHTMAPPPPCHDRRSVRVWKGGKSRVLEGHGGPVLAMVALPSGDILSGSGGVRGLGRAGWIGDRMLGQWGVEECMVRLRGERDSVMGGDRGRGFMVRLWTWAGAR